MRWTLDNKVAQVTKGNRYIRYWYDASGNRVMKRLQGDTVDYILRDVLRPSFSMASGTELQRIVRRQNSGASPILLSRESSLYGSSRLGTYAFSPNPGNDSTERRTNAKTTYELTDHLGNVRATVSDQKTYTAITGGYSLAANVLSASDLYPYGMAINSRSFAAGTYRLGFNTQEKSPELLADHTTALYWEYDARIGRRWNKDPKSNPMTSSYSALAGNPIGYSDFKGDTVWLFSTALPGDLIPGAIHTFIVVKTSDNVLHYYVYGPQKDASFLGGSSLVRKSRGDGLNEGYSQDRKIINGADKEYLFEWFTISVPPGMTQDEFDCKVMSVAESFSNNPEIEYNALTVSPTTGNCNTSTTTIFRKSGVSMEHIEAIDDKMGIGDWGFGDVKPWTKEEQDKAVKQKSEDYELKKEQEKIEGPIKF